jgi:ubiquinol-cytochrome c reductase cytochrome c subunit
MPLTGVAAQPGHRKPAFSAEDIDALVRHVTSFGGDGPPVPTVGGGDLRTGRRLYIDNCAACHSASGIGGALTNGRYAPALDRATPTQIAEAVRVGPGLMPAFPGTALTDQQVDDVVSYVQTLKGGRLDRGGASLGRLGPFTEGLVGLGIGLLLPVLVARLLGRRAGQ